MRALLLALLLGGCATVPDGALPQMVDIPAGRFTMGAPPTADAQQGKPQHEVTLRRFRLAATETTFAQYDAFARATGRPLPQDDGLGRGQQPVINIDRADALAFIDWLNRQPGSSGGFRLPSEAEWEYAARAGTTTGFYWGDDPDPRMANTRFGDPFALTAPVGQFPANPWGLHDMAGNVWEMTSDCLHPDYTGATADGSARDDPACTIHVARGGDYSSSRRGQRPSARVAAGDQFRSTSLGFRVAQDVP